MTEQVKRPILANFRRFFLRGLTILLPTVLTIWILIAAYNFVQERIANPINGWIRLAVVQWSPYPVVLESELTEARTQLNDADRRAWIASGNDKQWLRRYVRREKVDAIWNRYRVGMDLIGLFVAVILIYFAGLVLGSFIGHRLYARGEEILKRLPLVKQVYPAVKQITDFLFGSDEQPIQFNRVVAVQYPRLGIWSVGLVTGDTMVDIQAKAGSPCVTVFIPSSPTPFTGYTITVPAEETIDLPISIEDALRFTVSGGVVIPPSQTPAGSQRTLFSDNKQPSDDQPTPGAGEN